MELEILFNGVLMSLFGIRCVIVVRANMTNASISFLPENLVICNTRSVGQWKLKKCVFEKENYRHVVWLRNKSRKPRKTIYESSSRNLLVLGEAIRFDWHHFKLESNTSCKIAICSFSPSGNDHSSQEFSCHETLTRKERIPSPDGLSLLSEAVTLLYGIHTIRLFSILYLNFSHKGSFTLEKKRKRKRKQKRRRSRWALRKCYWVVIIGSDKRQR